MQFSPRSNVFDDVYFSAKDGLAETRHVFIEGNGLPGRWQGRDLFTIAETGFGTGLNFLAVWKLFKETGGGRLHFISFEKFPLTAAQIGEYLSAWRDEFSVELEELCGKYAEGSHDMDESVTLTLIFGDVNEELPKLNAKIDCWFLDGFKPAANPDMWTDIVFENMRRLSSPGATFATFTAAGIVKRGLKEAGFEVEKRKGFGWKRDMLAGHLK